MKNIRQIVILFLVLLPSLFVIRLLYTSTHPFGGIALPVEGTEMERRAAAIARAQGFDPASFTVETRFHRDQAMLRRFQVALGLDSSNGMMRAGLPAYYWTVRWYEESDRVDIGSHDSGEEAVKMAEQMMHGTLDMRFDVHGRLLQYTEELDDSLALPAMDSLAAYRTACGFLRNYAAGLHTPCDTTAPAPERTSTAAMRKGARRLGMTGTVVMRAQRIDRDFVWSYLEPTLGDTVNVRITVAGNRITRYETMYRVPPSAASPILDIAATVPAILLYLVIAILMIVTAIRRIRAYEIGFGTAIILGIVVAILFGIELYHLIPSSALWQVLISLAIAPLFVGGAMFVAWAVGESIGRETWKEKFIGLDLLTRGHLLHSMVGSGMLRGLASGTFVFAVWLLAMKVLDAFAPVSVLYGSEDSGDMYRVFDTGNPFLLLVSHHLYTSLFIATIFAMFLVSYLRSRFHRAGWVVPLAAFLYAISNQTEVFPFWAGIAVNFVCGLVLMWSFARYDLLTALVAFFTFASLGTGASFFTVGNPSHLAAGYWMIGAGVVVIALACAGVLIRDRVVDFDAITPAFARHVTERQRLQRELEIAREVQMSFLPKTAPEIDGLRIAARCVPALEVGGDYYDFIPLGPKKLAVAIGDVSGKGTQAAFYMTLAKGFLRALAPRDESPADTLVRMNDLFCDNVERGNFLSMLFVIFDLEGGEVRAARAGHNPMIVKPAGEAARSIQTPGLALGFESGTRFSEAIQDAVLPLHSGDLFVLYTDGFTEAMTKSREEYGEDRFSASIERAASGDPQEVIDRLFADAAEFTKKAEQHDDMTIVVVKAV